MPGDWSWWVLERGGRFYVVTDTGAQQPRAVADCGLDKKEAEYIAGLHNAAIGLKKGKSDV